MNSEEAQLVKRFRSVNSNNVDDFTRCPLSTINKIHGNIEKKECCEDNDDPYQLKTNSLANTCLTTHSTINSSSHSQTSHSFMQLQNQYDDMKIHYQEMKSCMLAHIEKLVLQQTKRIETYGQVATDSAKFWKKEAGKQAKLAGITQSLLYSKNILEIHLKKSEKQIERFKIDRDALEKRLAKIQLQQIAEERTTQLKEKIVSGQLETIFLYQLEVERKLRNITIERDVWRSRQKKQEKKNFLSGYETNRIASSNSLSPLTLLTGFITEDLGKGIGEFTHLSTGFSFFLRPAINLDKESTQLAKDYLGDENKLIEYQPLHFGRISNSLPADFKDGLLLNQTTVVQLFSRLFTLLTNAMTSVDSQTQ